MTTARRNLATVMRSLQGRPGARLGLGPKNDDVDDAAVADRMIALGATWDADRKVWTAPAERVDELAAVLDDVTGGEA